MEKLSVIVPVYNTYPYLRQCLESIINQTYKNLEIIVVNDASPYIEDDEICKEYASIDERIIYIKHEENKRQGGARNTGIKVATGKYITFIDSDDFLIKENIYELVVNTFKNNKKLDVVGFNVNYYYDETNMYEAMSYVDVNKIYKKPKLLKITNMSDIIWHKVFILNSIKDNNIYFKENFLYEDTDFMIKYIILINPIYQFLDIAAYGFRQRNDSVSHTKYSASNRIKSLYETYRDLEEIFIPNENMKYFLNYILENYREIENGLAEDSKELEYLTNKIFKNLQENEITLDIFSLFIKNEEVKKCYERSVLKYKPYKYKLVTPNIIIYKIIREIKRIIQQIGGIFKWKN